MGVRPGYKQTEVGVIPEQWGVDALGKSCDVVTKGTTPTSIGRAFTRSGVAFLKAESISESGKMIPEKVAYIDTITHGLMKRSQLKRDDLLISIAGVLGRVGFVEDSNLPANTNQALAIVRLGRKSEFERPFLFYALRSPCVSRQIRDINVRAAQANLSLQDVRSFVLPVPPVPEQRAIATALSDVDALLAGLDRLIAKKRDLRQAAMQQLLTGKIRLPGFDREWQARRLGDLADTDPENLSSETKPNFAFNYIALDDVDRGLLRSHTEQRFATAPSRARRKLCSDDVLVSTVRPNLQSHLLFRAEGANWVCSTGFCVVRSRPRVSYPGYIFFQLFAHEVSRQIDALLTGSNYPAITSGDVRALEIPIPGYAEQTAIATVLSDMDAELRALEARRQKTRDIKQAMMRELLTGKTRLLHSETVNV